MGTSICNGLDAMLTALEGQRVGLVGNHTSVTQDMRHLVDVLRECKGITLAALFAPEHGFYGEMDVEIASSTDARTGLPVHSLYHAGRKPTPQMIENIDVLLFSIQDVGVRFYTYISTMYHCLEAAAECGIGICVFDRPNPITGVRIEGNVTEPEFTSFISIRPLPIRHGMTLGELALMFNGDINADLTVAKMTSWRRSDWFDQTGWPWIMPSPAMPNLDTAIVYPGTCLYEGMNFSLGRGTSRPFELIGAPWMNPFALTDAMNQKALPGAHFRPTYFVPTARTCKDKRCAGVQIHVTNREAFEPVRTALHLLVEIRNRHGDVFDWGPDDRVNRKMGSRRVRQQIEAGMPVEDMLSEWAQARQPFEHVRDVHLLYNAL